MKYTLICLALWIFTIGRAVGEDASKDAQWAAPAGPYSSTVAVALTGDRRGDREELERLASEGATIAPTVQAYLSHPDPMVIDRALYLLARIDDVGANIIAEEMRSSAYERRSLAVNHSGPVVHSPEVRNALADVIVNEQSPSIRDQAFSAVRFKMAPAQQREFAHLIIPRLLGKLFEYEISTVPGILLFIGQYGEQGNPEILADLEKFGQHLSEVKFDDRPVPSDFHVKHWRRAMVSLRVAQASLGDNAAFDEIAGRLTTGTAEERVPYLSSLIYTQPSPRMTTLVRALLDDETRIRPYGPAHTQNGTYLRSCDFAAKAVGVWWNESLPVKGTDYCHEEQLNGVKSRMDQKNSEGARSATDAKPTAH